MRACYIHQVARGNPRPMNVRVVEFLFQRIVSNGITKGFHHDAGTGSLMVYSKRFVEVDANPCQIRIAVTD